MKKLFNLAICFSVAILTVSCESGPGFNHASAASALCSGTSFGYKEKNYSDSNLSFVYNTNETAEQTVYITPHGKCYHRGGCHTIAGHSTTALSISDAIQRGKRACKVCKP